MQMISFFAIVHVAAVVHWQSDSDVDVDYIGVDNDVADVDVDDHEDDDEGCLKYTQQWRDNKHLSIVVVDYYIETNFRNQSMFHYIVMMIVSICEIKRN